MHGDTHTHTHTHTHAHTHFGNKWFDEVHDTEYTHTCMDNDEVKCNVVICYSSSLHLLTWMLAWDWSREGKSRLQRTAHYTHCQELGMRWYHSELSTGALLMPAWAECQWCREGALKWTQTVWGSIQGYSPHRTVVCRECQCLRPGRRRVLVGCRSPGKRSSRLRRRHQIQRQVWILWTRSSLHLLSTWPTGARRRRHEEDRSTLVSGRAKTLFLLPWRSGGHIMSMLHIMWPRGCGLIKMLSCM